MFTNLLIWTYNGPMLKSMASIQWEKQANPFARKMRCTQSSDFDPLLSNNKPRQGGAEFE